MKCGIESTILLNKYVCYDEDFYSWKEIKLEHDRLGFSFRIRIN